MSSFVPTYYFYFHSTQKASYSIIYYMTIELEPHLGRITFILIILAGNTLGTIYIARNQTQVSQDNCLIYCSALSDYLEPNVISFNFTKL